MTAPQKTTAAQPYGLHWFRRDLRIAGNPALGAAVRQFSGRVLGIFCFDKTFLGRPDFSINRFGFFLQTLKALQTELRLYGGDLLVLDVGPREAFGQLLHGLADAGLPRPATVSFNRDYEPFARERDKTITRYLQDDCGITVQTERDHLLIEPDELTKGDGGYYQVYTPFGKRWFEMLRSDDIQKRIDAQQPGLKDLRSRRRRSEQERRLTLTWDGLFGKRCPLGDHLDHYIEDNTPRLTITLPPAGSAAALERLERFVKSSINDYASQRDFPARDGTSEMSLYLKNGSITAAQILAVLDDVPPDFKGRDGRTTFIREIAWREFYYHILHHRPDVETQAFHEKYRHLDWENDEGYFDSWKRGETGFPIVDAGMRQLHTTGWMHNRVRMIVASFLTKDLLINWQWGERYFMEQLIDGDLAPNNGGWQWAASTGCDPQPYFRIFNPLLQSQKFDPDGEYIRKYVPELRDVPTRDIHAPHAAGHKVKYPRPIVDHAVQKARALEMYRAAR